MKNIEFESSTAQRIYSSYLLRVEKSIAILSNEDKNDMLMEINSHIYEAIQHNKGDELETLLNVIENLGQPEEFLVPLVADKKAKQAVRTLNPKHVWQALSLNISNGLLYIILSFLYLSLTAFVFLIIAKVFAPQKTGLFFLNNEFKALGFVSDTSGLIEVLGYWFIPLTIIAGIIFYVIITLLFRFLKRG